MNWPSLPAERSTSSSVGVILMVVVTIIVGTILGVFALDFGEDTRDPAPEVAVEATFDARGSLDPHWTFTIRHVSGDRIEPGDLELRLVDEFGNTASQVYPESFSAGQEIRMGLWGSPNRANTNGVDCTLKPEAAPGYNNQQLVGANPPADEVDVVVVHEPSDSVMDRVEVGLSDYPNRYGTRLLDNSNPSFGCNDVDWDDGDTVVPASFLVPLAVDR
jgi:FlaG/FlaF family flagellin (archaellin)